MPVENLLTPDYVRRVLWTPPSPAGVDEVADLLQELGARRLQVELTAELLASAIAAHPS